MDTRQLRLALIEEKYLTVNVRSHPLAPFREELRRAGFVTSRELRRMPNGAKVKVAGRVILVHTPPTRSGVRVMFITAEDEYGLMDMVLFPRKQEKYARTILSHILCACEGFVQKSGQKGVSILLERIEDFRSKMIKTNCQSLLATWNPEAMNGSKKGPG